MSARNLQSVNSNLESNGFVQVDADCFRYEPLRGKSPKRQELPWSIQSWELENKGDVLRQQSFTAGLNAESFLQNFEDLLKERFPAYRKVAMQEDKKNGYWVLIEFLEREKDADQSRLIESEDAISHELPHGLAALHISVIQAVGQVSLFMTKHCFLGHTPGPLFIELPKILNQALFGTALAHKTNFNAYLLTIKSEDLRSSLVGFCEFPDFMETTVGLKELEDPGFGQTKLSFEGRNWRLKWSHGEETPELLVPPMEILEQKEVARRFQRLDELILLEDYAAALKICKEFVDKNPHSLYLIRRWAFLTLWAGIDFEQKYLDLMVRFDPTNLMTLSLWVRHGLENVNADVLLENLSKLGSSLGSSIVDFDSLDITGLTLPEMLGDAWNQKDDQRAVSCYERVLLSRGEIPRILVKLIRLMRDIGDPSAEELYMDRLLSCEVPQRTRAAIYYRLAEIKQKIDPADASEWALKSWHTNKGQVRYALLAADLLLQLERPHDAAHVLVETSELMDGTPVDQKLSLEVKIAAIWLEKMQRIDLAAERINRALDIVSEEVLVYDEIFRLVQQLDDAPLLIDVATRALFLAQKFSDLDRSARYIQVLLDLGDTSDDHKMASEIFTIVLKNALLDAPYTLSLFQRQDIELPFKEIVASIEDRIQGLEPKEQSVYFQLLGDLYQDRSEDPDRIFAYYEKALKGEFMNTRTFDYLDAHYSRLGLNSERFALLQKKLKQAHGSERAVLLRELYYFDEGIADHDKDSYAMQILAADVDDVGPIEERLAAYEQKHDGEAILNLMNQLNSFGIASAVMVSLVRTSLAFVKEMQSASRHLWLVQLLSRLRELGEDQIELARLTVRYLWDADEKNWVRGPLELLISRGEIPDIAPGEMLAMIDDDSLKVDLLLQLADRGSDFQEILAYEREAFRLTRDVPMMMSIKLEIQHRLVTKSEFAINDLEPFLKQIRSMGNEIEALHYLVAQLRMSSLDVHKSYALREIQTSLQTHNISAEDGAVFVKMVSELPLVISVKIRLAWLTRYGIDDVIHNDAFFEHVLGDPDLWSHGELLLNLMGYMVHREGGAKDAKPAINAFICRLMLEKREETLQFFLAQDFILGILDSRTTKRATEYSLQKKDTHAFQSFWWLSLIRLQERQETIEFLHYSRKSFAALDMSANFFARMEEFAERGDTELDPKVIFEIKLFYADCLIETSSSSRKARNLLEDMRGKYPQEARIWGILIAFYREIGAEVALHEILGKVLPFLKEDPRPLKEYQLSVTGLEQEFIELSARVGNLKEGPVEVVSMPYAAQEAESDLRSLPSLSPPPFSPPPSSLPAPVFSVGAGEEDRAASLRNSTEFERPMFGPTEDDDSEDAGRTRHRSEFGSSSANLFSVSDHSLIDQPGKFEFKETALNFERTQSGVALVNLGDEVAPTGKSEEFPPFSFTDGPQFEESMNGEMPSLAPMRTQLAVPDRDALRAQVASAAARDAESSNQVSFFDQTNAHSLVSDLPPPPPPSSPLSTPFPSSAASLASSMNAKGEEDSLSYRGSVEAPGRPQAESVIFDSLKPAQELPKPSPSLKQRDDLATAWRRSARSLIADEGLTENLIAYPLKDMTENVVAVQAAALIENKMALLENFPQRIWRDPAALRFELKWIDRMDREMFHPGIKSPLARLLKALYPLFIQGFTNELGLAGVADRLKIRPEELLKARKLIPLSDDLIQRTNLRYYTAAMKDNGYSLYHLPAIGDRFQYDFEKREVYVDRNHYLAAPPTRIFHRLTFLLRAVSLDYYPFLHLSAGGEIFPFLMKCKRSLDQSDSMKRVLGIDKDPLRAVLAQTKDRDYLAQLFAELGNVSADKITTTISHFIEQIYRLNLAETLDLVGVIETIFGVDMCSPRTNTFQRISQSASAKSIMAFAADLRLNGK